MAEISENAQRNTPVTWLGRDTVAEVGWLIMMMLILMLMLMIMLMLMLMLMLMMMLMVDVDGSLWCRRRIWDIMRLR